MHISHETATFTDKYQHNKKKKHMIINLQKISTQNNTNLHTS